MKSFKPKAKEVPGEIQIVNIEDYDILEVMLEHSSNQRIHVLLKPLDTNIQIAHD